MTLPKVKVYLTTYNRPHMVMDTVDSILGQDYDDFGLLVSDNSTDNATEALFSKITRPKMQYRRRVPSSENHMPDLFLEANSEYCVFFHDDDLMMPGYLETVVNLLDENPDVAAVGTNGYLLRGNAFTTEPIIASNGERRQRIFYNPTDLARVYLTNASVAPFPSYAYRMPHLNGVVCDLRQGGRYADVSLLMKVASRGPIVWFLDPLIHYRIHPGQDSQRPDIHSCLSLLRYIYSHTSINRHSLEAITYRRIFWCSWLKLNRKDALKTCPKRYFKVLRIMLPYLLKNKVRSIARVLRIGN